MKNILLFLLLGLFDSVPGSRIAEVNKHKSAAEEAVKQQQYDTAISHYQILVDSLDVEEEGLRLNMAHAHYLKAKQLSEKMTADNSEAIQKSLESELKVAIASYEKLQASEHTPTRAIANNQLGHISMLSEAYKQAVPFFKSALKADPTNEAYRYNYELAKKLAEQQKKEEEQKDDKKDDKKEEEEKEKQEKEEKKQQEEKEKSEKEGKEDKQTDKKDGENKSEEKKEEQKTEEQKKENQETGESEKKEDEGEGDSKKNESEEGEKKEEGKEGEKQGANEKDGEKTEAQKKEEMKKALQKRLENINMSDAKAKMILEAMRNQEKQYYQQMQKGKRKKKKSSKPDW